MNLEQDFEWNDSSNEFSCHIHLMHDDALHSPIITYTTKLSRLFVVRIYT